ncbi:hypothetical protein J1N35_043426 [Gossypium stocksii]|uniref:Uncharacterized protein n=1 Tax=Gossypium stocksii TaxID=47602 RepID=A0A9D3ZEX1_9ROSI|nr:hypothetical protein J1N35_043426 [Gossypium stocksii]
MLSSSSSDGVNGDGKDFSNAKDSSTKKVRFKDTDVAADDVMVVDPLPVSSLSWKDKLLGKGSLDQAVNTEDQSAADGFLLSDQDVKKSLVDGVPSIDFSDRVFQILEKEMSTSIILKMLVAMVISIKHVRQRSKLWRWLRKAYQAIAATPVIEGGDYRPWMLVEQKVRRRNLEGTKRGNILKKGEFSGSRFHTLADLEVCPLEQELSKIPQSALENKGKEILIEYDFIALADIATSHECLDHELSSLKQANRVVLFNPVFEENDFMNVEVKEGVLEASNHSAVVFNNKSPLEVGNEELRDSHLTSSNQAKVDYKSQSAKKAGSKGGWKLNKTLKGLGNKFKMSENSRVPFAESMKRAANLITSEIEEQSVNDLSRHLEKEVDISSSDRQ